MSMMPEVFLEYCSDEVVIYQIVMAEVLTTWQSIDEALAFTFTVCPVCVIKVVV